MDEMRPTLRGLGYLSEHRLADDAPPGVAMPRVCLAFRFSLLAPLDRILQRLKPKTDGDPMLM
jgi:hypothetical protein